MNRTKVLFCGLYLVRGKYQHDLKDNDKLNLEKKAYIHRTFRFK